MKRIFLSASLLLILITGACFLFQLNGGTTYVSGQPFDFVILQQQRFARRTKHRIPAEATKVSATDPVRATRRHVTV